MCQSRGREKFSNLPYIYKTENTFCLLQWKLKGFFWIWKRVTNKNNWGGKTGNIMDIALYILMRWKALPNLWLVLLSLTSNKWWHCQGGVYFISNKFLPTYYLFISSYCNNSIRDLAILWNKSIHKFILDSIQ